MEYKLSEDYILLKQLGIKPNNIVYDAEVANMILTLQSQNTH